jgi:hypothetical protein
VTPTEQDLKRDLEKDLVLCDSATPGPWYTVDGIWLPPNCGTYVIAGHYDLHRGKPVLDHIDIDESDADQDGPDYSQSDADLEFAAEARTGWPAAIRRASAAESQLAEAIARVRELEAEIAAVPHPSGNDGTDRLVLALHGRAAVPRDYLGASNARMLHEAADEVERLRAAIRKHRDYRGDNRCHLDDGELYAVLPEGDTRPAREVAVTLENCQRYIECRQKGREYVSPQVRIEELENCLSRRAEKEEKR